MRNFDTTKNGKPSELNDEELEKVGGGDGKTAAKAGAKDTTPSESVSLNFNEIKFSYTAQ